jgi:hypothetical protein
VASAVPEKDGKNIFNNPYKITGSWENISIEAKKIP